MLDEDKPPASGKIALIIWGLAFSGLSLILLSILGEQVWKWDKVLALFVRDLGLLMAAVMGGTILHEELLRGEMLRDIGKKLDTKLDARIPRFGGLRHVDDVRRNSSAYYSWVVEQKPEELFFAGRSVLHRIDADIQSRIGSTAEKVLLRRLKEGSKITIAFLDPSIDIIGRLAVEEDQRLDALLGDIATSIGICRRLHSLLLDEYRTLPKTALLKIKLYNAVPYFAYHKQGDRVVVGFYFRSDVGSSSAAYEIVDAKTKEAFGDHFKSMASGSSAKWLLEFDGAHGNNPTFNEQLFQELYTFMEDKLGAKEAKRLICRQSEDANGAHA